MDGGERHESFSYPDEEWAYYLAADKFGWTPSQTDEQPAYLVDWLLAISVIVDEVKAKRSNDSK